MANEVPIDGLRERLEYDPETGILRWRKGRNRGQRAGSVRLLKGYRKISLGLHGKVVQLAEHRVAWALAMGAWPPDQIDHRNGKRDDNRLTNLRPATMAENHQNRPPRARGKSGLIGACKVPRCKDRWRAAMNKRYLGTFGSAEEAHQAYLAAKTKHHPFQPVPRDT